MAGKENYGYYDENGVDKKAHDKWEDCSVKGAYYVKFKSKEERDAFENDGKILSKLKKTEKTRNSGINEIIIKNLKNVKIDRKIKKEKEEEPEKYEQKISLLNQIVNNIIASEKDGDVQIKSIDVNSDAFNNICNIHKDVDVVVFADGSADKEPANDFKSTRLGFGLVLIDINNEKLKKYSYIYEPENISDEVIGWLLGPSNDSAEKIAAVAAMKLCEDKEFKSIRIYQDNEGPAQYLSGNFKKVRNEYGKWYIESSLHAIEDSGIDVQYIYIPSHVDSPLAYEKLEKEYYNKNKNRIKIEFKNAKYFNDIVDELASVQLENKTIDEKRDELIETLVDFYGQDYKAIRDLSLEELQELKKECVKKEGFDD